MKKMICILIGCLLFVTPCIASELRVISDLQFSDKADAIKFLNEIEKLKKLARKDTTTEGYRSSAKMVESWDTEFTNKPETTLLFVDFSDASAILTHKVSDYDDVTKAEIDELETKKASIESELSALDITIAEKQAELDLLNTP